MVHKTAASLAIPNELKTILLIFHLAVVILLYAFGIAGDTFEGVVVVELVR